MVAVFRGVGWVRFGVDRACVGGLVEWSLLFVEHVSAGGLRVLAVVELCLVCVAPILGMAQFGLTPIEGGVGGGVIFVNSVGCVRVERVLRGVQSFLVTVSAGLFAFGDALVQVGQRLLEVKLVLLAGTRVGGVLAHV
jgi:hypothetical protein